MITMSKALTFINQKSKLTFLSICCFSGTMGVSINALADSADGVTATQITIGTSTALSGPGGSVCSPFTDGASAYFKYLNKNGGVLNRQIRYLVEDDAYQAGRASQNIQKLLKEPIFAIVGGCGTVEANVFLPLAEKTATPLLFTYASLRTLQTSPIAFTILPRYEDQIVGLLKHAFAERGPGRVFIASNIWPGQLEAVQTTENATKAAGGSFVGSIESKLGTADYTPYALKIKMTNPDYIVVNMGGADAAKLVNSLVEQDALPPRAILGVSTFVTGGFIRGHSAKANAKIIAASPVKLPASSDPICNAALKEQNLDQTTEPSYVFGCAQAALFVKAVKNASSLTRNAVLLALTHMKNEVVTPVLPPVTFTDKDHLGINDIFIATFDGGEAKTGPSVSLSVTNK